MGMDVYGKNPINKEGEYFRRNVWGWHPLWDYVEAAHPEIAELVEHAHSNSGDGLSGTQSLRLATLLESDLKSGKVTDYLEKRKEYLDGLPRESCSICNGTGIRSDKLGVENGQTTKVLTPEQQVVYGREIGWCNGCDGAGDNPNWATNYYVDEEDIFEFATFLKACGGFEIC